MEGVDGLMQSNVVGMKEISFHFNFLRGPGDR